MSSFKSVIKESAGTLSLISVLVLSLGLNVYLARKARFGGTRAPLIPAIKVNTVLPSPLQLLDATGKATQLVFDGSRPTVIYVLSPACGWCRKNEANIKALVARGGSRFRFVGLSTTPTGLKDYIAKGHAPFPVYSVQSPQQAANLGLAVTPETIVVGPSAKVEKAWMGAYMGDNEKQVEQFFDAKLPGLQNTAAHAN